MQCQIFGSFISSLYFSKSVVHCYMLFILNLQEIHQLSSFSFSESEVLISTMFQDKTYFPGLSRACKIKEI